MLKRNKKILSVVEEILVIANMLDFEIEGSIRGGIVDDGLMMQKVSEVKYELCFTKEINDRKITEKLIFVYRNTNFHHVQVICYPLDSYTEFNKDIMFVLLDNFKKNLIQGGKEYVG